MGKEIRVRYYGQQSAEELYKNIENNRVYVRQPANVSEIVFWLTSNKWQGGYEADCPIREGITMVVVDKNGNELFRETLVKDDWNGGTSASKKAPFLYEATKECARKCAENNLLASHKWWYDWLLSYKEEFGYEGYDDNWLYTECTSLKDKVIGSIDILGKEYKLVRKDYKHNICNKTWKVVFLIEKGSVDADEICGYIID